MTANDYTSPTEERTHVSKEPQDCTAIDDMKNMMDTQIVQYADRERDVEPEELAALLREYAEVLDTEGFEAFRPGL